MIDKIDSLLESLKDILEEAPTTSVASGNIAGIGHGEDGEPGFTPSQMRDYKKRNKTLAKFMKRK